VPITIKLDHAADACRGVPEASSAVALPPAGFSSFDFYPEISSGKP